MLFAAPQISATLPVTLYINDGESIMSDRSRVLQSETETWTEKLTLLARRYQGATTPKEMTKVAG